MQYYLDEQQNGECFHAGNKAREDIIAILRKNNYQKISIKIDFKISKFYIINQYKMMKSLIRGLEKLKTDDQLLIQLPLYEYHTIFIAYIYKKIKKKKVKLIGFIHDLDYVRTKSNSLSKIRLYFEEKKTLKYFDKLIVHNNKMYEMLSKDYKVKSINMIILEIFDYLANNDYTKKDATTENIIIFAGNLLPKKSGFIYKLDGIKINLYGPNYANDSYHNYCGQYDPNILPNILYGKYGLVWDGDSIDECSGITGEYLKINCPHKLSLYLSSGIPVIVWKQSAISDFVLSNKCGVLVDNLNCLSKIIDNISQKEYLEMKNNAIIIKNRLRRGFYTEKVLSKLI